MLSSATRPSSSRACDASVSACDACAADRAAERLPGSRDVQLDGLETLGDESVFLRWNDGHETLYLVDELRALCRCAYCVGEPERPITG